MANPRRTDKPFRLTKRAVDAARPRDREYVLWDTENRGFGLKVLPSGRKVYLLKYRTKAGEPRKPTIGVHGDITADQARRTASDWRADITKGGDPSGERQAARRAPPGKEKLFRQVVEGFIEHYAKKRQRTWEETERILKTNCAIWSERPISSIAKAEVYDLLEGFIAKGHDAKARVTHAWLRKMFRWAVTRGLLEQSVLEGVEIHIEQKTRERYYEYGEIKRIWQAADQLDPVEGSYVKLILLLGVRKRELAGMARSEFDDRDSPTVWTVPHERTKTRKSTLKKRAYIVPLPRLAQRIIKSLPRLDQDLVFPGRHKGKPLKPGTYLKKKVHEKSGVQDWTFHTCRHTISTWFENEGHSEYERALVLNHAATSVTAGYSHGYPLELKRQLLEKWADHIATLVQPEGAVLLT